jgi:hypothetical protein
MALLTATGKVRQPWVVGLDLSMDAIGKRWHTLHSMNFAKFLHHASLIWFRKTTLAFPPGLLMTGREFSAVDHR